MGRASNPSVPQRVSAHVVPKAVPFPADDEDEKTTIESGWEEEASTTVEQGDVAEKIRALGGGLEPPKRHNTGVTSTTDGVSDEPTVDEQRASAALAQLPPSSVARLFITLGNDAGQSLEVRPGKTYTIGRGVDNDLVLTDPAVSRKHFDLRHDDGAWMLADRASGNGTLVNAQIEDAPIALVTGDAIEIGNTSFRFELAGAALAGAAGELSGAAPPPSAPPDDDAELSTVSGKPLRDSEPRAAIASPGRPKTLPPPAPLPRTRPPTNRPVAGFSLERNSAAPGTVPPMAMQGALVVPPQAMLPPIQSNRAPLLPPAILHDPPTAPQTTLPGQGPPVQPLHPARMPFPYAQAGQQMLVARASGPMAAQSGVRVPAHAQITQLGPQSPIASLNQLTVPAMALPHAAAREGTSTALVQPISYNRQPVVAPHQPYRPRPLSKRTKLVLGASAIVLFVALLTIAIVSGGNSRPVDRPADAPLAPPQLTQPVESRPTIEPIREPASAEPPGTADRQAAPPLPTPQAAPPLPTPQAAPPQAAPPLPTHAAVTAAVDKPAAPASDKLAVADAPPTEHKLPPRTESKIEPKIEPKAEPKTDARPDRKPDKRPPPARPATARAEAARIDSDRTDRSDVAATTKKRTGHGTQDAKSEASALYRSKNFSGAAALLTSQLGSFSGGDVQDLKNLAAIYSQLGKAYNIGMAPGTRPVDAYVALQRAKNYDQSVGAAYVSEIDQKLVSVASRAAASYMAAKEYEAAFQAVRVSDGLGSTSQTNKAVRTTLDGVADDLYRSATGELTSDPDDAKKKLRQILGMIEPRNPLFGRATKLLNGS